MHHFKQSNNIYSLQINNNYQKINSLKKFARILHFNSILVFIKFPRSHFNNHKKEITGQEDNFKFQNGIEGNYPFLKKIKKFTHSERKNHFQGDSTLILNNSDFLKLRMTQIHQKCQCQILIF
ncbi:unnamed protein product [Paramecium primaurelia]|uniref:Uncharacterized protein n=1 Tax=Paramecium primaurelia TaxID=5886 RepID=A0A8S1QC71_PARPR|nr:unnamed protein product [Paramecium primaurelia]